MSNDSNKTARNAEAPPPPFYICREHKSTVNYLHLFDKDQYLASCDNDGWIVIWKMQTKRPIKKWKAHQSSCLKVYSIDNDTKLISQGRDNKIHIWKLITAAEEQQQQQMEDLPELISSITYNGVGFCKFACFEAKQAVILCFPSKEELSMFDIYDLTNEHYILQNVNDDTGTLRLGTCMAVQMFVPSNLPQQNEEDHDIKTSFHVLAGYESGMVVLWDLGATRHSERKKILWHRHEHKEPILDLAVDNTHLFGLSSSADNQLCNYSLSTGETVKRITLKKSGVVSLRIRSDNKIFASGGYDNRIRLFSVKTMKPLAILSYHKGSVYSLEFGRENHSLLIGGSEDNRISLWNIY
ncbi:WD40-repeat-containing domain protein [Mycotypha africana]|uniref:WD40-repeat-containing domain protein n=1 Tax=Mycotypha africana TaxID=64632 RepID=UPI00230106EB|nr:WD40-repeat-containing domain protein [Mycotypha africana]KAI8984325.1 WD40-repeat-containing domain protein [Mycotypha africana]